MKKILFISSRSIYPVVGGDKIRTIQQLEFLLEKYNVDVVFLSEDKYVDFSDYPNRCNFKNFHLSKWKSYFNCIVGLFMTKPLQVSYYYSAELKKWIHDHASEYDAVFCNNIRTAEYVKEMTGLKKYLDFVDSIAMNYNKARNKSNYLKKIIYEIDFRRLKKYEKECLGSFDECAIISEVDKNYILS